MTAALETPQRPAGESDANASAFLDELAALQTSAPRRGEPERLAALRQTAISRFRHDGFPHVRLEEWRFTNTAPITRVRYRPAARPRPGAAERAAVEAQRVAGCALVVMVDGFHVPELSSALPEGVEAVELAPLLRGAAAGDRERALELVAAGVDPSSRLFGPFAMLNTAFFEGGLFLRVAPGATPEQPIQVLNLAASAPEPCVGFPRTLIAVERSAQATVLESYARVGDGSALVLPITETFCAENGVLRHYRVNDDVHGASSGAESRIAQIGTHYVRLERAANVVSLHLSFGGDLVRSDVHARLDGEGADCVLNGLYLVGDRQLYDTHMRVEHKAPHCGSHELFKGVLDGAGHAVFNGRIYVHKGAQKTDAKQTNRNLLLSDRAVANSNPQLEIFADDVKCTHGSTIGQLEPEALFYLRSRGIEAAAARSLLTLAFASELLELVRIEDLRVRAEDRLARFLPGGDIVGQMSA